MTTIHSLRHSAYRCRDAEATRAFYQDFLGLPLVRAVEIRGIHARNRSHVLHLYFQVADGALLVFFEARDVPFVERTAHGASLQLSFDVDADALDGLRTRAAAAGFRTQAIGEHGRLHAVHVRDPNGYVVELCGRCAHERVDEFAEARAVLARWQREKEAAR